MQDGPTIGVVSTSFGGSYFGSLLAGIKAATQAAGGRIIAIQTLDAGTVDIDLSTPPRVRHRVAAEHISAYVVILNAADHDYLAAARDAGRPIVMISADPPGLSAPVVLPHNGVGVREAVDHLVAHGHRDIAFAGYPTVRDFRERYDAYCEALRAHGIEPRDDLFFDTGSSQESGGELAARAMIAAGLPSTAVLTGNDLNAVGLMRTLAAAGYELPRDQAVVGFDDMPSAVYLTPSLSTVRQRFDEVGHAAVTLALRQLAGEEVSSGYHYVATCFVARESCGCPDTLALGPLPGDAGAAGEAADDLLAHLPVAPDGDPDAVRSGRPVTDRMVVRESVGLIEDTLRAAAQGVPGPGSLRLRQSLVELRRLTPRPEDLVAIMRGVRDFGRRLADRPGVRDTPAAGRVAECVQELVLALAQSQARQEFRVGNHFQATLNDQYTVGMELLRTHEKDPRRLSWIRGTPARAACLGLWTRGPGVAPPANDPYAKLDVVSVFDRDRDGVQPQVPMCTPQAFPPAEVVALADLADDNMVFVAPMKVNASDWGLLAVVGPIEAHIPTGRETMNQWTALLTIALDQEALLESLREREEQLRYAALYDQLTGLPNRTLFLERLKHAMTRGADGDYHYAVLMLDLDGFKLVNDSMGHLVGDQLLVQVAARLGGCLRDTDIAARFGGDEFAVLLDDLDEARSALTVTERIRDALARPFRLNDEEVVISASVGIALGAADYRNAEDILRDADTAMYAAKVREKGSEAVFDVAMHTKAVGRLRTEADLRGALDRGEFELHYQPIVGLATGHTCGVEALIRWRHPGRGLVPPDEFLPTAEECGLILPIGRWVLDESCRQLRAWRDAGAAGGDFRVSVNVSNRQFWRGRLIEDLRAALATHRLAPDSVVLEITEGVIMHDVKPARRMLDELHDMGVELHIDDFGTGRSSLEALSLLPIDSLKIDRSFVAALGTDRRSTELVRTIVLMGVNLGMELVAEGIETDEQWSLLRRTPCTYGQGYLFSRPRPAAELDLRQVRALPPALPHGGADRRRRRPRRTL